MDFDIQDHGTIALIHPITDAAKNHAAEVYADAVHMGGAIACEPRMALDNAYALQCDWFTIGIDVRECELQPN